ncbi:MAG: DinB family protein [Acidobacteriota bacterium]
MDEQQLFLKFFEDEGSITRKVMAKIPEDQMDYRPHPNSRSAGELAWVLVNEEAGLARALESGKFEWGHMPIPATMSEILAEWDKGHDQIVARLKALGRESWEREIPFVVGGQELMRETGFRHAWMILFDQVHHRGQLSTYLRPMGATVPSIYGPSADDSGQ